MALQVSSRSALVSQSEIRSMTLECAKRNGLNLAQGVCDLDVPPEVIAGAKRAMDDGYNIYTRYDGLEPLRRAVAEKQKRFTGLDVDPECEVVVSNGATGAFYSACMALLNPGDEVILFEPYYGYHVNTLLALQAVPVFAQLRAPDWDFSLEDLQRLATPRTRAILINTPVNPCGKVFSREELILLADFAVKRDLFVFTDEIYEHFVYDGLSHLCPATLPGMKERTIVISGLSKIFSVTGWRLGYAICDAKWSRAIGFCNDLVYVCGPAPLQMGAAAGLAGLPDSYYRDVSRDHERKRDLFCAALAQAGLTPLVPRGAYYALADMSRLPGATGKDKAMHLLERTGVACVPGKAFFRGAAGENLGRFCFAKKDPVLLEACERLKRLD